MISFKKLKKRRVLGLFLIFFVIFFFLFRSKSYELSYTRDGVSIVESYSKKEKLYTFLFRVENKEFFVTFANAYKHGKEFVDAIEVHQKEDTICILPKGSFAFFPLCIKKNNYVSFHLISDRDLVREEWQHEVSLEERNYGNFKIYNLNQKRYFIWNYKGFTVIDKNGVTEIPLFSEDVYTIPLTIQMDPYIVLGDYSKKYEFQKFYVINSKNNKVKELETEKDFSFDAYFLGVDKKKAYFVDKKNKLEYEINPKRLLINKVTNNNQGKILVDGEWEYPTMTSLVTQEKKFTFKNRVSYELSNQTLYRVEGKYKTQLSNQKVKEVVYSDATTVYYLVEDQLYFYNDQEGEVLVLSNFEWNFNYQNMIFIF